MGLLGGSAGGGRRNMGGGFHFWNVVDIPFSHMNPIPTPVGNPVGEAVLEMCKKVTSSCSIHPMMREDVCLSEKIRSLGS